MFPFITYINSSTVSKVPESSTVSTIRDIVPRYPLLNLVSTLCSYTSYFGWTLKVNLNPLASTVMSSRPCTSSATAGFKVEPGVGCSVLVVPD